MTFRPFTRAPAARVAGQYSRHPARARAPPKQDFISHAELYRGDASFAGNDARRTDGTQFVRDAMRAYAEEHL